jgi:hypothetical protein
MKSDWIDPERGPTPEQLAAYADGELAWADRAAVEAWLSRDAAAAAEVESLRRFTQAWRDAAPSPPGPEAWSSVRNKIEAGLRAPPKPAAHRRWPRRLLVGAAAAALGAAAAAVLAVALSNAGRGPVPAPPSPPPDGGQPIARVEEEEPYPVVGPEDVVIVSIGGADTACLVAARPPVDGITEHELAREPDLVLLNVEPHRDGSWAEVRFQDPAPTMVTPPVGWQRDP